MSDALSDSLKPSFWEGFFSNPKDLLIKIKKQKNLFEKIEEYNILSELNGVNEEKDLIPLKKEIMKGLLKIYSKGYKNTPYYNYMFLEDWRFPSDYFLKELEEAKVWKR